MAEKTSPFLGKVFNIAGKECMGKIDVCDKMYFSDKRRFADFINVHIYQKRKTVFPKDLLLMKGKYPSISSASGEKERDILMEHKDFSVYYGLELEESVDYSMPERMLSYDVGEYERQVREIVNRHKEKKEYENYQEKKSRMKPDDKLNKVVNLILYLGEGHWDGPRKMSELFEEKKANITSGNEEYELHIIESDYVNPNDYETDLKEFFLALQCRNDKKQLQEFFSRESFQNLSEEAQRAILVTLKLDAVIAKKEKEGITMCRAFEELMQDQWRDGKKEGKEEGENLLAELLKQLLSENRNEDVKLAICDTDARGRFYREYGML